VHSVSVAGAVVGEDGRFLVIRRADNGRWEPPGGVLEVEEDVEAGVRREVWEETGVRVRVGPLTGVYKNMKRGIVALVFRCEAVSGTPRASEEAADVRWLSAEQVEALMTPAYACRLLDALSSGPPVVRAHDGHDLLD